VIPILRPPNTALPRGRLPEDSFDFQETGIRILLHFYFCAFNRKKNEASSASFLVLLFFGSLPGEQPSYPCIKKIERRKRKKNI